MQLLVAVDSSEHSKAALAEVRRLAWPAKTSVFLLSVVRTEGVALGEFDAPGVPEVELRLREERRRAEAMLAEQAVTLKDSGLPVATLVADGDPRQVLCEVAKELGADWLVVGSNGRQGFQKLVLGSVASHVVTHAPCSVLVVKSAPSAP